MSIDDVYKYAMENNIDLNEVEANIIYKCIKNDWKTLIYSNHYIVLNKYKSKFRKDIFCKIEELINLYKVKYKNYLKN